jgi:NADH-quinone oxidoreductase subunit D
MAQLSTTKLRPNEMLLNMGPQHPSTHGVCRLVLKVDGEKAVEIEPVIGYLHRGMEKLAENRSYIQFLPLTDRLDYVAALGNNMVYVQAIEELMEIEVPERADHIRVIMLELQRIASHLLFISSFGADVGAWTVLMYGFRERERILDLLEMTTGGRMVYSYIWPGGVRYDLPDGFVEKCRKEMEDLPKYLEDYKKYFYGNEIFLKRCEGVGVLKAEDAVNLGVTGANLRACGVARDVRKDDPYSIYDQLDFKVITEKGGDTLARFNVRLREVYESINIVKKALDALPTGDFRAKIPKILKPPFGEVYSRTEAPRGELSMYLVSDGESKNPFRLKIRSPSFCNLSAFPSTARGEILADVVANFASIDIVLGDVDR